MRNVIANFCSLILKHPNPKVLKSIAISYLEL